MATRKSNVRRRPTVAQTTQPTAPVEENGMEVAAPDDAVVEPVMDAEEDVEYAPTTKAPDGEEAVVTIDGDPIRPNFDGSDGETFLGAGASSVSQEPGTPAVADVDTTKGITTTVPDGKTKLTDADILQSSYRAYWQGVLDASGVTPPDGRVLFPGEPLTFNGNVTKKDHIILGEDIYRMVLPQRARRVTFTLEARAGKRINRARVLTKEEYLDTVRDLHDEYGV